MFFYRDVFFECEIFEQSKAVKILLDKKPKSCLNQFYEFPDEPTLLFKHALLHVYACVQSRSENEEAAVDLLNQDFTPTAHADKRGPFSLVATIGRMHDEASKAE